MGSAHEETRMPTLMGADIMGYETGPTKLQGSPRECRFHMILGQEDGLWPDLSFNEHRNEVKGLTGPASSRARSRAYTSFLLSRAPPSLEERRQLPMSPDPCARLKISLWLLSRQTRVLRPTF